MDLSRRIANLSPQGRLRLATRLLEAGYIEQLPATVQSTKLIAYAVARDSAAQPETTIREHCAETLPAHMVPAAFVFLDQFPLTPNGKIDIDALPDTAASMTSSRTEVTGAENSIQQVLIEIWEAILGVAPVGIHDNFFEIGGDSILSIQMIARARGRDLQITPKQIFQHPTIAELSRVVDSSEAVAAEQGKVTGDVPLMPIQQWLLDRNLANPDHWNQCVMLRVPVDLDTTALQQSLISLALHHDMLRARFHRGDRGWTQRIDEHPRIDDIRCVDLSKVSDPERKQRLVEEAGALQASLDLAAGRLLAAAYFEMDSVSATNRLCIVVHHRVIDTVSWSALLEDLETLYRNGGYLQGAGLPPKTTAYRDWAHALRDYAGSDGAREELEYWLGLPDASGFTIPVDFAAGENTELSERKCTVELPVAETRALLSEVPAVYNTRIDDILLTALAQTINAWTGSKRITLGMEGHGRETVVDGVDLSRTVGWFTTYFPVHIELDESEYSEAIKSVKEQLRAIPSQGIGYGALRYLAGDPDVADRLAAVLPPVILYNYLGQIGRSVGGEGNFKWTDEDCGPHHDPADPRSHLLEIDSMIVDDRLIIEWIYSENIHRSQTIRTLADRYLDRLTALISHCMQSEVAGISASDFPQANLDQADLDELLGQLED